jgi:hypothetical protein
MRTLRDRWRCAIHGSTPFHILLLTKLLERGLLVLALQRSVVALVEAPRVPFAYPGAVNAGKRNLSGVDRAVQHRSVRHVGH